MTSLAPIGASIPLLMASALDPLGHGPTGLATVRPSAIDPIYQGFQVTVLDAAAAFRPRQLIAKAESDILPPGPAPDAPRVELSFSLKIGGEWLRLGSAVTDRHAFARLPFPRDLDLPPGLYDISVSGKDGSVQTGSGRLLITSDRPTLLVDVDGPVLDDSHHTWGRFFRRNLFHQHRGLTRGARDALRELSQFYQIVYLAPLRDESTLDQTREDLFQQGKLPPGPIFTNDFGLRLKENSKTVSLMRLHEFVDNAIAELRGFDGVPIVGGIGLEDRYRPHAVAMKQHGLETQTVPDSGIRFWQFWKWLTFRRKKQGERTAKAWESIRDYFAGRKNALSGKAQAMIGRRYHPDPHIRFQTELDLVTGAKLYLENAAKLYTDGPEALDAVKALFCGAETVFAEIYEFGPDRVGNAFADIFSKLAAKGKSVRLTVDLFGSEVWLPRTIRFFAGMARAGVRISRFKFSLAEFPDIVNAFFFRTHRKVVALKVREKDDRTRDIAILGGRNWKEPYWNERYDNTIVVEGPVVQPVVEHLERVTEMIKHPLRPEEKKAFAVEPRPHPDNMPARYVVHYPKEDQNIQRAFVAMLNNPESGLFMMESPFPLMSDLMREIIAAKRAHPNKEITWITGTFGKDHYGPGDALRDAQTLILKKHGIRAVVRAPLNKNKLSPMHVKRFTDGLSLYVGSWNPDEQSNKDLEAGIILSPNPGDGAAQARLQAMVRDVVWDAACGIDIEEWLQTILPKSTGDLEDLYRKLLLKIAPRLQRTLNYFL